MAQPWIKLLQASAASSLNDVARVFKRRFPEVLWSGDQSSNALALSYDDGPDPVDTPALLAVLRKHGVTATFSWLGERIEARPDLVAQAAAEGHQLMIHGYRHRSFLLEQPEALRSMLGVTRELLARHSGRDPELITCVRPPFGHLSTTLIRRLIEWGYQPVICSVMPVHWVQPANLSVRHVVSQVEGGSLIVLHESLGGPPVAELTDSILTSLADRGLSFVTVDTLRAKPAASGAGQTDTPKE